MNNPVLPILTLKLVVMAMLLEPSNRQSTIKIPTNEENLVKIGPIDPEVILLYVYLKKKEINASRTYNIASGACKLNEQKQGIALTGRNTTGPPRAAPW